MEFEWDEEKNRQNISRHGFDFAVAWEIFLSPMLIWLDTREDYGEIGGPPSRSMRTLTVILGCDPYKPMPLRLRRRA